MNFNFRTCCKVALISGAIFGLVPVPAIASNVSPAVQEELLHKQQREAEALERQRRAPDVRLPQPPSLDGFDLPTEASCFQVKKIILEGDSKGDFSWAQKYLAKYEGRCIGQEGIDLIVKRLSNKILSKGYITTRIGIPEQDLKTGILKLVITPGVIRKMEFEDKNTWGWWQTAFPTKRGALLDLRDLEQGVEQMRRLPYQEADIEIKPGEEPGESDVLIKVKRAAPWRVAVSMDDSGSKGTGKYQGSGVLSIDNPLGINDMFYASGNMDVNGHWNTCGSRGYNFFYSIPYGYWLTSFNYSKYFYKRTVQGEYSSFVYTGNSNNMDLGIQYLLHRDQTSKTWMEAHLFKNESQNFLDDVEVEVQHRKLTTAEIVLAHRHLFKQLQADFLLSYKQGLPILGAQEDPAKTDPEGPTTLFKIVTADIDLQVPISAHWRYRNHLRGQYTADLLSAQDQFAIGGRYTIRGFDGDSILSGENGWYTRNELSVILPYVAQEFYFGVDHGQVFGPSTANLSGNSLTGGFVGMRGAYKWFSYDVFAGWAIAKPSGFETAQPALGFRITAQY